MQVRQPEPTTEKEEKTVVQPSSGKPSLNSISADLLLEIAGFTVPDEKADHEEKEEKKDKGEPEVYGRLALVNRRFNLLFREATNEKYDRCGVELLEHIVRGHPDQVIAILKKNPSLMLHEFTVTDDAGYTITAKPYRAALCSQDPQMAAILQGHLVALAGEEEALAQWNAQFPPGWEKAEQVRWQPLFDQLAVLDRAIRESAAGDITSNQDDKLTVREESGVAVAHAKLMSLLKATQDEPIETGRAFNPHFMQAVANLWDTYVDDFDYEDPRRLFCWQRVFGGTQCFVPAADAASFIDWLDTEKLKKNQPQNRSMKIRVWDHAAQAEVDSSFFPDDGSSRLGVDYAIFGAGGRACGWAPAWAAAGLRDAGLEHFYQSKTVAFQKSMPRSAHCALM